MSLTDSSIRIENVVASSAIDQEINLGALVADLESAEYEPENFPGLVYHLRHLDVTVLIFRSGKIVCTGATNVGDARTAIENVFDDMNELGIDVSQSTKIEIQNIVSTGDLGQTLNLSAIAIGLGLKHIEYEPEQFPGLVYRLKELDVVALLFSSGRLVITGCKRPTDAEQALDEIEDRLAEFEFI